MDFISLIKQSELSIIKKVAQSAKKHGILVWIVGGFVRDQILGRASKDIDFVCLGQDSGISLANHLADEISGNKTVSLYRNYGTASIILGDIHLEFVGARKESYQKNSRNPIVETGTLQEDQLRRDFTINAMAVSLNEKDYGTLIDPFNGLFDLNNAIIKTPLEPETTFSDDPLRMMRAIRFATQLEFSIDKNVCQAIKSQRKRIQIISKERISDELNKIILSRKPSKGFLLLFETKLLDYVLPELQALHGVEIIDDMAHKDNFFHTIQVLDNVAAKSDNLWLRWSAILHDIGKPATKAFDKNSGWTFHGHDVLGHHMVLKIFKNLKLPLNEKMKYVQKLVLLHLRPIGLVSETVTDSAIRRLLFDAGNEIDDLMLLCEADITSKNQKKVKQYLGNFEKVRARLKEVEKRDQLRNWQPPIDGKVIMDTFNIKAGKKVGIIKMAIREAILDGKIENNFEAAFDFMKQIGDEIGLSNKKK